MSETQKKEESDEIIKQKLIKFSKEVYKDDMKKTLRVKDIADNFECGEPKLGKMMTGFEFTEKYNTGKYIIKEEVMDY